MRSISVEEFLALGVYPSLREDIVECERLRVAGRPYTAVDIEHNGERLRVVPPPKKGTPMHALWAKGWPA